MRSPLASRELLEFDALASTQTTLAQLVKDGSPVGGVLAHNQTAGRGRFDRVWLSEPDVSLTVSLAFHDYAFKDVSKAPVPPHLIGMAFGLAAAGALRTQIRWPNDLAIEGRKVAGILAELIPNPNGEWVPVVGIGVNLSQKCFDPSVATIATSLALEHGEAPAPRAALERIMKRLEGMPEPTSWQVLDPIWRLFDATRGKKYRVGEEESTAIGVGTDGQLICEVAGETRMVVAAEAIFGPKYP